jgi:uncharacterized protein (UPF0261 family)
MGQVVLIGTLDTKGREYDYIRTWLREAGADVSLVDIGVLGEPGAIPDISASQVAEAGGASLQSLRHAREGSDTRAAALAAMGRGCVRVVEDLRARGLCDAVLGAVGSGGASVLAPVFQALPLGVPKLLVTTMGGYLESLSKTRDITLMQSVTDVAGLNRVSRQILRNAAFAAAGMAASGQVPPSSRPLVAVTMFGVTTPGVLQVERRLQAAGFETITFHAVGSGGRAMEEMIESGLIDGVVDYTISELTDELLGGIFSAGPTRLEAAGKAGIPQVIVPGAIEVLNFGPRASVPPRFDTPERRLIVHNENVTAVRTTRAEAESLGRIVASKANLATGPVAVMAPLQGFDSYQQRPDGPWIDPETDAGFYAALRHTLDSRVALIELEANINDKAFADAVAQRFCALWAERPSRRDG